MDDGHPEIHMIKVSHNSSDLSLIICKEQKTFAIFQIYKQYKFIILLRYITFTNFQIYIILTVLLKSLLIYACNDKKSVEWGLTIFLILLWKRHFKENIWRTTAHMNLTDNSPSNTSLVSFKMAIDPNNSFQFELLACMGWNDCFVHTEPNFARYLLVQR